MSPQRSILVVDDNTDIAEGLAAALRVTTGSKVLIATDGAEAIELAIDNRPQAIVMDIGMPGVGGLEAARVLRRLFKDDAPQLVAVTGLSDDEQHRRILEAGFDAHLAKPVDLEALIALLGLSESQPQLIE